MLKRNKTPGHASRRAIIVGAAAAAVFAVASPDLAVSQTRREVVFATNIDPNNDKDPRAAAQSRVIAAFEKANTDVAVRLDVDPKSDSHLRALRAKSSSIDVVKIAGHSQPEFVATGQLVPLDDLILKDNVSKDDWLLPLAETGVGGKVYGLPLDYRMPLLLYRKSALEKVGAQPPRTWAEVCETGGKLAKVRQIGYAIPLGQGGGSQAFDELMFSSMVTAGTQKFFGPDNRTMLISKEAFIEAANVVLDLFGKCGATPAASQQFGYNEIHDGLRADTIGMANFGLYRFAAIVNGGAGSDLGWAPAPSSIPNGKHTVKGYLATLNAASKNRNDAWRLIKFLGSPEGQAIAAEGGEVIARTSAYENSSYFATPDGERQKAWAKLIKEQGYWPSYPANASGYNRELLDVFQKIAMKRLTPAQGFDEFATRYKTVVNQE